MSQRRAQPLVKPEFIPRRLVMTMISLRARGVPIRKIADFFVVRPATVRLALGKSDASNNTTGP